MLETTERLLRLIVYGLVMKRLHSILSSIIVDASLRSLPHHFKMSLIHLLAGRPGRRSPLTIPNNSAFNSRSSGILQICPNSWSLLFRIVSTTGSPAKTAVKTESLSIRYSIHTRLMAAFPGLCEYGRPECQSYSEFRF